MRRQRRRGAPGGDRCRHRAGQRAPDVAAYRASLRSLTRHAFVAGVTGVPFLVVERCLHEVYAERGWDLRTPDVVKNTNLKEMRARAADAARRTSLCFEQQMLDDDVRKVARTSRLIMAQVLAQAGVPVGTGVHIAPTEG